MSSEVPTKLLALDWGTTSARVYRLGPGGAVLAHRSAPCGVQHVESGGFPAAFSALLGDWRELQVPRLACGMIGSRQGWIEAPYRDCPVPLPKLAEGLARTPGGELAIVPGLTCRDDAGVPDVMRGEETQVIGLLASGADHALVIHPGTHSKWTVVAGGAILAFTTYMTGETFGVLREHSILGRLMDPRAAADPRSFERGVRRALAATGPGDLLHHVFGARTLALFGELAEAGVADYLSGVLIGAEVAAGQRWAAGHRQPDEHRGEAWLVGTPELCSRYRVALELAGLAVRLGPQDVAAAGLWHLACASGLVDERN